MTNVAEFLLAVKYLERHVKDRDVTQSAVLFAWEHLDECRGKPRAWLLAIAWHVRRDGRKRLSNEIKAMGEFTRVVRTTLPSVGGARMPGHVSQDEGAPVRDRDFHRVNCSLPEQEQAVLLREIEALPGAAPIFRPGGCMVARMRARERVQATFA